MRGLPKPETLHELFDRQGIELHEMPIPGRHHGGYRSKIILPGVQRRPGSFFVAIDPDGRARSGLPPGQQMRVLRGVTG
jgi:hypothetical protein